MANARKERKSNVQESVGVKPTLLQGEINSKGVALNHPSEENQTKGIGVKPTPSQKGVVLHHPLGEIRILDFSLPLIEEENDIYTPVYKFYENIGLSKTSFNQRIKNLKERGIDFKTIPLPTKGGTQKTLCINIFDLPALLYLITVSRLKPELRERVKQIQIETTKAIRNYWKEKFIKEKEEIEKAKAEYNKLVEELKRIPTYEEYRQAKELADKLQIAMDMIEDLLTQIKPHLKHIYTWVEWKNQGFPFGKLKAPKIFEE